MTRSAVDQRVKALACDLQAIVGVESVDEHDVLTVASLRAARHNYLEELDHYQFVRAGLKGVSALSARRTVVHKVKARVERRRGRHRPHPGPVGERFDSQPVAKPAEATSGGSPGAGLASFFGRRRTT